MKIDLFAVRALTALLLGAVTLPGLVFGSKPSGLSKALTEDQKILHVLNRLGFGARPGDVARVKAMGLQRYIDQQLDPSSINDGVSDAKLKNLEVFNMSTAEVFAKYPNPGALLRQLEGGRQAQANAAQANPNADREMSQDEQRERRQKLQEIYRKYDLRPANQLLPQIVSNRVLRAVYSERQLQEVMVDFWQNHFNVAKRLFDGTSRATNAMCSARTRWEIFVIYSLVPHNIRRCFSSSITLNRSHRMHSRIKQVTDGFSRRCEPVSSLCDNVSS